MRPRSVGVVESEGCRRPLASRLLQPRIWELLWRSVLLLRCKRTAPRAVVMGVNIVFLFTCGCFDGEPARDEEREWL